MMKRTVEVKLQNGLEARPVAMLVQVASRFDSKIYLEYEGKKVNAKSIMGMMSLGLIANSEVAVEADGADEAAAIEEIVQYLNKETA